MSTSESGKYALLDELAEMPAGRYWDLQLVQNYVYPWATFGKEPMATWLKAAPDELIHHFPENEINVVPANIELALCLNDGNPAACTLI